MCPACKQGNTTNIYKATNLLAAMQVVANTMTTNLLPNWPFSGVSCSKRHQLPTKGFASSAVAPEGNIGTASSFFFLISFANSNTVKLLLPPLRERARAILFFFQSSPRGAGITFFKKFHPGGAEITFFKTIHPVGNFPWEICDNFHKVQTWCGQRHGFRLSLLRGLFWH